MIKSMDISNMELRIKKTDSNPVMHRLRRDHHLSSQAAGPFCRDLFGFNWNHGLIKLVVVYPILRVCKRRISRSLNKVSLRFYWSLSAVEWSADLSPSLLLFPNAARRTTEGYLFWELIWWVRGKWREG